MIKLDGPDDVFSGDQVHAAGDLQVGGDGHRKDAEVCRRVFVVAVADWLTSRLPAAALVAARERTIGLEETVVSVFFPLRGLASARDDDAGPVFDPARFHGNGRCKVHREGHG